MNMGVADGVDLGWKLAAVLQGWGGARLLDSYESERRPVHELVLDEAVLNHSLLSNQLWQEGLDADSDAAMFSNLPPDFPTAEAVLNLREAIDTYLTAPDDWHGTGSDPRPVIATWMMDWTALFDRSARVLQVPG